MRYPNVSRSVAAALCLLALAAAGMLRFRAMQGFDAPISLAINQLARRSELLDYAVRVLDRFNIFQGLALFAVAYAAFDAVPDPEPRIRLVIGCIASSFAAAISRSVQLFVPHAPRPMFDPALGFTPPIGSDLTTLRDWSSFPSDHAALLFGLAFSIWLAHRKLGLLAFGITTTSALIRLYEGEHYLTDIVGGGLLAIGITLLANCTRLNIPLISRLAARGRTVLVMVAFLAAGEAGSLFPTVRAIGASLKQHLL